MFCMLLCLAKDSKVSKDKKPSHLYTFLVNLEDSSTNRVVMIAFQKSLWKPTVKAIIILFLQLRTLFPNTVHYEKLGYELSAQKSFSTPRALGRKE